MAELCVDIFSHAATADQKVLWKGELVFNDLKLILYNLLGKEQTESRIAYFIKHHGVPIGDQNIVNSRFVNYSERLLSGVVGAASARLLISSLSKEEEIELSDVVKILKESSEIAHLNKALKQKTIELEKRSKELMAANEKLKFLDLEKDDFISTVTHEMRTPLTAIKAMIEIIQDNPDLPDHQKGEFLDNVIDQIDRMSRLIDQVLDLEKLETGQTDLDSSSFEMDHLIADIIKNFVAVSQEKGIEVIHRKGSGNHVISGDEERLTLVLTNLISNAIKSIDHESGKIEIDCQTQADQLQIRIKDNGKGIRAENINHIFDKFFQAKDQGRKKPKGSGLGLSITKKIIELHGGTISVESQPGQGSTFIILLPISKDQTS